MQLLVLFLLWVNFHRTQSFASWMTNDFCDRALIPGEVIMNNPVEVSDERQIRVYRENTEIFDGEDYYPGEKLLLEISNYENQYLIEVSHGRILTGGCNGKRIAGKSQVYYNAPSGADAVDVTIVAGWAEGHSVVRMTKPVVLKVNKSGDSPPSGKVISETEDKLLKRYRARGYVPGSAKVVPDQPVKAKSKASSPSNGEFAPRTRGNSDPFGTARKKSAALAAEEKLRGKSETEHIDSNIGTPPKEGRDQRNNADVKEANIRVAGRQYHVKKTEEKAEVAHDFSYLGHVFSMNEMEFLVVVLILLIFIGTLVYQIYSGKFYIQIPCLPRFAFKSAGSRYNN